MFALGPIQGSAAHSMIFKCFAVVRAIGERAHHLLGHAVHRLFGSHGVHANRTFAHGLSHPHITGLPAMVCVATGIAALGAGGLAIRGTAPRLAAPSQTQAERLLDALVQSHWNEVGSQDKPQLALAVGEIDGWSETATPPEWEVNSSPVAPIPTGSNRSSFPDTPNPAVPVPEPTSISVLGVYLLMFAALWPQDPKLIGKMP